MRAVVIAIWGCQFLLSLRAQQFLSLSGDTVLLTNYQKGALIIVSDHNQCSGCMEKLGETIKRAGTVKAIIMVDRSSLNKSYSYRRLKAAEARIHYPDSIVFLAPVNDHFLAPYVDFPAPFVLLYANGEFDSIHYRLLFRDVFVTRSARKKINRFLRSTML